MTLVGPDKGEGAFATAQKATVVTQPRDIRGIVTNYRCNDRKGSNSDSKVGTL